MFKYRLQWVREVLHGCIEEEIVGGDGGDVVGVDCRHDGCPGGAPTLPRESQYQRGSRPSAAMEAKDQRGNPPPI